MPATIELEVFNLIENVLQVVNSVLVHFHLNKNCI